MSEDLLRIENVARFWPVDNPNEIACLRGGDLVGSRATLLLLALLGACLFTSGCITSVDAVSPTAAVLEGARPALAAIQLADPATNAEIEGYASAASVNRGEDIKLFVNTKEPSYSIEVFRVGWYGGRGMKRMTAAIARRGLAQALPMVDSASGLIECDWQDPYVLHEVVPGMDAVGALHSAARIDANGPN